jgi:O-acetylhomoserine/O-acetylserine sulfhydrylase-like pyridoxal-dependent enzyme
MENKGTNYAVQTAFASNYIQSKCTGLSGFQISRDAGNCANPRTFPGYSTNLFSYQNTAYNHTFGSGIHNYYGSTDSYTRWGVLNNNQGDFATVEALSGIGLNYSNGTIIYSAGDYAAGGGAPVTNLNRSTRFEMYGR